jgi:hypothetical protein
VAPPFPGAFTQVRSERWWIHKTRVEPRTVARGATPRMVGAGGHCYVECLDGTVLRLLAAATVVGPLNLEALAVELQKQPIVLS